MSKKALQWRAVGYQLQVNLQPPGGHIGSIEDESSGERNMGSRALGALYIREREPKVACIMAFDRAMRCIYGIATLVGY